MKLLCAAAAASLVLAGCAMQPARLPTATGQPEARFAGLSSEQVRDRLASACMADGMQVQSGPHEVVCSRTMTGGQGMAVQLLIGTSYGTPPAQVVRFNVAADGPVTVRVIAHPYLETQTAYGQVRRTPVDTASAYGDIQAMLRNIGGY